MTDRASSLDYENLFKLRLVVARHGEMDAAGWWNTKGILGRHGTLALRRGFPATHYFAQARIAFAVARSRCREVFDPPGCMTLWTLPAEIEDRFEERWQDWLDQGPHWAPFFEALAGIGKGDLLAEFEQHSLINDPDIEVLGRLRRSAEGRAVPLPDPMQPSDAAVTLLAAGFAKGEPGAPAVPYARIKG